MKRLTSGVEATELKGSIILQAAAIADRLEGVLERLEAALAAREAENRRLRRVEAAASDALAELDQLLAGAGAETTAESGTGHLGISGLTDGDVIGGRSALRSAERG